MPEFKKNADYGRLIYLLNDVSSGAVPRNAIRYNENYNRGEDDSRVSIRMHTRDESHCDQNSSLRDGASRVGTRRPRSEHASRDNAHYSSPKRSTPSGYHK